jgi:hypothetical protein
MKAVMSKLLQIAEQRRLVRVQFQDILNLIINAIEEVLLIPLGLPAKLLSFNRNNIWAKNRDFLSAHAPLQCR